MPFRSYKQRTWMQHNKPAMYEKWKAEHGTKIVPSSSHRDKAMAAMKSKRK